MFIATLLVARALLPGAAGGSGAPARSLELQKSERPPTATRMSKVLNDPAGDLLPAIGRPRTSAVLRVPGICAGNVDSVNARNWPSTDALALERSPYAHRVRSARGVERCLCGTGRHLRRPSGCSLGAESGIPTSVGSDRRQQPAGASADAFGRMGGGVLRHGAELTRHDR